MSATRELFFNSPTAETAAALAAALQQAGYLVPEAPAYVPADPDVGDAAYYDTTAYVGYGGHSRATGYAELAEIGEAARRLAEEHGSEYAGGGEFIGFLDTALLRSQSEGASAPVPDQG